MDDEYTREVSHLRIHDEGYGWAIDGAKDGKFTEQVWNYDTKDECLANLDKFRDHLEQEGVTFLTGPITRVEVAELEHEFLLTPASS